MPTSTTRQRAARAERFGLGERAAEPEEKRDDRAAERERQAPTPRGDRRGAEAALQREADQRGDDDGHLLARRLERDEKAAPAGRRHLGEVDGDAAELDAGREALREPAAKHEERRDIAERRGERGECREARRGSDGERADRHDRQRDDETAPAPDPVDVGAEQDGAERPHQERRAEGEEGEQQARHGIVRRKERVADRLRVEAEQEEVEHLEKIAARHADDGHGDRRRATSCGSAAQLPSSPGPAASSITWW